MKKTQEGEDLTTLLVANSANDQGKVDRRLIGVVLSSSLSWENEDVYVLVRDYIEDVERGAELSFSGLRVRFADPPQHHRQILFSNDQILD